MYVVSTPYITVVTAICEMLWGVVVEAVTTHISNLKDFPKGHFASLLKVLNAQIVDCPHWWAPTCTLIGTDDCNGIKATYAVAGCPSMQIAGEDQIEYRCVSYSRARTSDS